VERAAHDPPGALVTCRRPAWATRRSGPATGVHAELHSGRSGTVRALTGVPRLHSPPRTGRAARPRRCCTPSFASISRRSWRMPARAMARRSHATSRTSSVSTSDAESSRTASCARCESCDHDLLVAFSCKLRGLCPSCAGRRMANEAASLVDRVLPAVPVRQWVLSLPFELRALVALHAKALTALSRMFAEAVGQWSIELSFAANLRTAAESEAALLRRGAPGGSHQWVGVSALAEIRSQGDTSTPTGGGLAPLECFRCPARYRLALAASRRRDVHGAATQCGPTTRLGVGGLDAQRE